jgi:microcystin-dependent protein
VCSSDLAEWQAQAAVQSSVGYYSSGDGSTTFRLPRLLDYPRGGIAAEAGAWLDSQNKAHNHSVYLATDDAPLTGSGAGFGLAQNFNNPNISGGTLILNAVAIGSEGGTESRPKTIKFLFCVKAFDAPTNQGLVDITELANELAGKVSKTETGYRVRKWASGEYTPVLNTPCIVNHGLDIDPENCLCDVRLKCVVAEGGYSVGDFAIGWYTTASVSTQGTTHAPVPKLTASEIQFNTGDYTSSTTNGIGMLNKNSGAYVKATLANWRYVFRIFY